MKPILAAAVAGFLFALGLGVSGMTDPAKVVGFLDFTGAWDPSLAFVMAGAVGTHGLLRRLILRRPRPVFAPSFPSILSSGIDRHLLAGSALFGIGWGLSGYCPGPAFTSVASGNATVLLFVGSLLLGMLLHKAWERASAALTGWTPASGRSKAEPSRGGQAR